MKALLIIGFLAGAHAHKGSVSQIKPDTNGTYATVEVFDCTAHFVSLYADEKLTIPLSNPFSTGSDGKFLYFDGRAEEDIVINFRGSDGLGLSFVNWNTCPLDKEQP